MSYADEARTVEEFLTKRLKEANLVGRKADSFTLDRIRMFLHQALADIRSMDIVTSRWDVRVDLDPVTKVLHVQALAPWRDWSLVLHRSWRSLSLDPVPMRDASHAATRVQVLRVEEHKGRRNVRYAYVDYTYDPKGNEVVFTGRDNDWEDDFRRKFPIPE